MKRPTHSAFPHGAMDLSGGWDVGANPGMTLRDYFAAKVLAGWNESYHRMAWEKDERTPRDVEIATVAYEIADAMLRERAK